MKPFHTSTILLCCAFALLPATAPAAGDARRGKQVYQQCAACHDAVAGGSLGPSLVGVVGRAAAGRDDYRYSNAMKRAGFVWDETHLRAFLKDPQQAVRGTKMPFTGMAKDQDVNDLIAYLGTMK